MTNKQEIFILIDDSGKFNINEHSCIYGGLFFYSSKDYMNFINKYKSVVKSLRCNYCNKKNNCNKKCIEIKDILLKINIAIKQNNYILKLKKIKIIVITKKE